MLQAAHFIRTSKLRYYCTYIGVCFISCLKLIAKTIFSAHVNPAGNLAFQKTSLMPGSKIVAPDWVKDAPLFATMTLTFLR